MVAKKEKDELKKYRKAAAVSAPSLEIIIVLPCLSSSAIMLETQSSVFMRIQNYFISEFLRSFD